jgi:hypothetical protein
MKGCLMERNSMDYALFGLTFLGFVVAAAGVATISVAASVTGLILMAIGLGYFSLRQRRED